eukprot:gnl/TRDRNA2_/TRDRNA2_90770_c0_seq1.p1 gnl/TRDRNA2_/TRDRNA2_90770_c0~~gnl/TRDRNA2_/TRDRNA2_90770_c0_seq1.p1  ORF type:complete len:204 (-),score=32.72 gnl/TRDRNA2_/TRDRNA2_90770_c0_seq1:290-901(-)
MQVVWMATSNRRVGALSGEDIMLGTEDSTEENGEQSDMEDSTDEDKLSQSLNSTGGVCCCWAEPKTVKGLLYYEEVAPYVPLRDPLRFNTDVNEIDIEKTTAGVVVKYPTAFRAGKLSDPVLADLAIDKTDLPSANCNRPTPTWTYLYWKTSTGGGNGEIVGINCVSKAKCNGWGSSHKRLTSYNYCRGPEEKSKMQMDWCHN